MDLLMKTRIVKLRSHLDKFLVCDEDRETVKQSRNGSTQRAIWVIEPCPTNQDAIRIKSLRTGLYLTASDGPFLLGMTGKRVVQLSIFDPTRVEWVPINDGFQVKFRSSKEGTYLRGNGGPPPWRNSITHDVPLTGGTYAWTLWHVDPVSLSELGSVSDGFSLMSSFSSVLSDDVNGSPLSSIESSWSPNLTRKRSGMDLLYNAKSIRLRSHHNKYLTAEEDEESVTQNRNGSTRNAKWVIEFTSTGDSIRLKSTYDKYLTASNNPYLLGMTGLKVVQTRPVRLDTSTEWEPVKDGSQLRLKTRHGNYLRANGGVPPWRNSVTHDVPHRTATKDWVVWDVDILDIVEHSIYKDDKKNEDHGVVDDDGDGDQDVVGVEDFGSDSSLSSVSMTSDRFQRQESNDSGVYSSHRPDGRLIHYHVADENGDVNESMEGNSFTFIGHTVAELTQKMKEETRLDDIYVCTHSPLNGKLYPLRLQLPPNNATMHIVVVPSTSKLAQEF